MLNGGWGKTFLVRFFSAFIRIFVALDCYGGPLQQGVGFTFVWDPTGPG